MHERDASDFSERFRVMYPYEVEAFEEESARRFFNVETKILASGGDGGRVYEDPTGARWYLSPNLLLVLVRGMNERADEADAARAAFADSEA